MENKLDNLKWEMSPVSKHSPDGPQFVCMDNSTGTWWRYIKVFHKKEDAIKFLESKKVEFKI